MPKPKNYDITDYRLSRHFLQRFKQRKWGYLTIDALLKWSKYLFSPTYRPGERYYYYRSITGLDYIVIVNYNSKVIKTLYPIHDYATLYKLRCDTWWYSPRRGKVESWDLEQKALIIHYQLQKRLRGIGINYDGVEEQKVIKFFKKYIENKTKSE